VNNMTREEIENEILVGLYTEWENHTGGTVYTFFGRLDGVDEEYYTRVALGMERASLIDGVGKSMRCEIRAHGIIEAEARNLVPREKIEKYQYLRYLMLSAAATAFEERPDDEVNAADLISQFSLNDTDFFNNSRFLADAGLLHFSNAWYFRITDLGIEQNRRWALLKSLEAEYAAVADLPPNTRGIQFQSLIARALASEGWNTNEGSRTSYEEMDIFIDKNGAYYLIECKWTNTPISTDATSHLLAKLGRREGVRGILMSMAGFTAGAVTSVQDASHSKIILLFGKGDIEQIINRPSSFDTLVAEKEREFVTRRNALWS